jgi:uncharacterized protein (DUF1501 family)
VRGDDGPLEGARTLHVAGAARARGKARPATSPTAVSLSAAARHIEETRRAHQSLSAALAARLAAVKTPSAPPLAPKLEGAVDLAARVAIVAATGAPVAPVVKLTLPGFDTHTRQRATQDRLLGELGEGLASLRARLVEAGAWSRTVVVVMSEFGRRVAPNDNGGTDHGAAGPVLVCGGDARGGLVGAPPRLDDLADGDLRVRVEHRDVFASIARRALGTADDVLARELSSTARLPLFRA